MFNNTLKLLVNEDPSGIYQIVDFLGNLDSESLKEQRTRLFEIVNSANKNYLVFNFLNLDFINSESISLLLQFNEILQKKNIKLILVNAKKNVVDVLNVIGVLQIITYFHDLPEFTKTLSNVF